MKKKVLAIDLGASSGRGIIGSLEEGKITLSEIHRFSNDPVLINGKFTWDILRLFFEIRTAINKCVIANEEIQTVGIDTWGVDYGYLDKNGNLIGNPYHYRDERTKGMIEHSAEYFDADEHYTITGIQQVELNTIYQMIADIEQEQEKLSVADKLLQIPDLLNYFLTGKKANEYTILSTGGFLDAVKRDYAESILTAVHFDKNKFGKITQPGTVLGTLLPDVQMETGKTDMKVMTVASHDTASAVLAVPTQDDDFIFISSGTWSLMGTELKEPLINEETRRLNYTNEGGAFGTIRFLKNIMGLWLIQESRRQWKREGKEYSFAQLEQFAKECKPFACFINPTDSSFVQPGNMPERIREYCRKTNQYVPVTEGEIIRCIYESLAFTYRQVSENMKYLIGKEFRAIHIVGGGTKDTFLSQMTADATGMKVVAGPTEATAIGNIIMQYIANGDIRDLKSARKIIADSFDVKTYLPDTNRSTWDKAYETFCKLN